MYGFTSIYKRIIIFFYVILFIADSFAQQKVLIENLMVQKFYDINLHQCYWFSSEKNIARAIEWLTVINSSYNLGFVSTKFQIDEIRAALYNNKLNDSIKKQTDEQITGIVLNFFKILQQGNVNFEYDEVSVNKDSVYIYQLLNSEKDESVSSLISRLECKDHDYIVLKNFLNDSITAGDTLKSKIILLAMNYRRYLSMNHHSEYIIVNIPAAEAEYFNNDTLQIKMRTVVGRKTKQTPVFASYITNIVTFPYWNVPRSIAVNEILPYVKKNENYLEQKNFDVVDAKGVIIQESELKWNNYNAENFPYFFRQSTGEGNALGVLKFNLQNPFSIFLHATSWPENFKKENRFLSHGCVQLEKPFNLANALLRGEINIEELKSGKKNIISNTITLIHKVPTFIIYIPVTVEGTKVTFLQDVYDLIK